MRININEKYCITSNTNSMMVNQRSVPPKFDKDNEEVLTTIAHLLTLNQCYKFLLRHQIRISKATGFQQLMEEVGRIEKELDDSIRI